VEPVVWTFKDLPGQPQFRPSDDDDNEDHGSEVEQPAFKSGEDSTESIKVYQEKRQ